MTKIKVTKKKLNLDIRKSRSPRKSVEPLTNLPQLEKNTFLTSMLCIVAWLKKHS